MGFIMTLFREEDGVQRVKESEKISRDLYMSYLEGRCSSVSYTRGDNPPDFVFTCDGVSHAVEVTELHQSLDVQGKEESRAKYDNTVAAICERCEEVLGRILDREIHVVINSPVTDAQLKSLTIIILSYAKSGNRDKETLFGRDDCWLESWIGEPSIVEYVIPAAESTIPDSDTLSIDIQASTDYAVERRLCAKRSRMEALGHFPERVLIIYSTDRRCRAKHVKSALLRYKGSAKSLTKVFFLRPFRDLIGGPQDEDEPLTYIATMRL